MRPEPSTSGPALCHCGEVFRLLGLLGGLSTMTDLGTSAGTDESLHRCLVATRFARALGCSETEVATVLYTSLLQHLGCTAYAHESAATWGDDVTANRYAFLTDWSDPRDLLRTFAPGMAAGAGTSRTRVLATMVRHGRRIDAEGPPATCEVARDAAGRLGLPGEVGEALHAILTRWNGKGFPRLAGDAIPRATRIMHVASTAVLFSLHADPDTALRQVAARARTELDPELAAAFGPDLLAGLAHGDPYLQLLDAEPDPARWVGEEDVERVARTFGDLADLKSPWLHGHSAAVGDLAGKAAAALGSADQRTTRLAGYLHDVGRVAVSSAVWDKPDALTASEREALELHPYWTEKVLSRVPELATVARVAGQHHERCDGSGYHRGLPGSGLVPESRVLAAADRYRCLVEDRPHRPATDPDRAAAQLAADARAGLLDADAVAAVREAAGHETGSRRPRPAGLTERQVEVLRLVASGLSNREIGDRLVISRRTAEHHVQDVYSRIGTSTRAGAALFAMEHGLLGRSG